MKSSRIRAAALCAAATPVLFALACGGGAMTGGTGGAGTGSGGSKAGSGGVTGTGGSNPNAPAMYPFPQGKKPAMCNLTGVANASTQTKNAYDSWYRTYVTDAGAMGGLRVKRPTNSSDTVSEGIGYGMLAAVYVADRATFDGLWKYAKAEADSYSNKALMNWHVDASGVPIQTNGKEPGSATDADEDMAWALLMAAKQWSSSSYSDDAKKVINAIYNYAIGVDGLLKPGDNWGSGDIHTFPDYFSPAYFRAFAVATNNTNWSTGILTRNYEVLMKVADANGLVPDETTGEYVNVTNSYGYDACRTPWRIGMDYCFNEEPKALAYLTKIGTFFNGKGVSNIVDGYTVGTGNATGNTKNMAFIGPAGVAGMPTSLGFQTLLDDAFTFGVMTTSNDYYKDSLRLVTMLMMSGNLVQFP
jgi:endo-1,4-beta-D-glucanase Y